MVIQEGETDAATATIGWARALDEEAWVAIYRELYPRLRAFFVRRVGVGRAEDAVAETMSRAVAGIHRFDPGPSGLNGWVFGIARHVAADVHRQAHRKTGPVAALVTVPTAPWEAPEERVDAHAEQAALRRAFSRLDPREQEVLELRVVAGLSAEETAAALGKRAGAVRTAQMRALAHLRQLMEVADG